MDIKQISQFPRPAIEQLLAVIPFYKTIKQQDLWQFELLLQHSRVVSFDPGEVVLKSGERDSWLYFLLKGQLAVYVGAGTDHSGAINYITPGEVFGDLAMLVNAPRTATVVADVNSRQVLAFATDFAVFGEVEDFRVINLNTKLVYYRNTVHNLRWKLEVYRSKYPDYELANHHHQVKLFSGQRDTREELTSLHEQAVQLARLLVAWNQQFGAVSVSVASAPSPHLLAAME